MSESKSSSIRVLVVDDQGCMRAIIRQLLGQAGIHDVEEAADGEDAFALLQSTTKADPDVILCDLHMENVGGIEFCNRVRRDKTIAARGIPILILTGDEDDFLHDITRQVGAAGVIMKPVSAPDLRARIEQAIGFCGAAAQ